MDKVTSADGTPIAFDRLGDGPPIIVVAPALCDRAFGQMGQDPRRLIARHLPAGRHHVLPGQHHLVPPEVLVPVVTRFLDG
ncbi:hypothetical protein E1267_01930 [Nonomuraea longispora]|uniref:Alpha/beta hydrolase n=1 Tax=Nonomuraea longispora TaxID=1848320 RepID=A0A4R4NSL8_9ACTN|nr:hypothetical protein [Nonomuraea longispora]TDC10983.1 hypothetical protein E1267_01930 [Nonomuraea longispora]